MRKTGCVRSAAVCVAAAWGVLASASPQESVTLSAVASDGRLGASGNAVRTATFSGAYSVGRLRITGTLSEGVPETYALEARLRVTPPTGSPFTVRPFTEFDYTGSISVTDFVHGLLTPVSSAAGEWAFRFFESFDDAGVDSVWDSITITLDDEFVPPPPPPGPGSAEDLGTIGSGTTVTRSSVATPGPYAFRWYRFTVPAGLTATGGVYLDIDTNESIVDLTQTDTEIGLFRADGTLAASDDDDGLGLAGLLSFGSGTRPGTEDFAYYGQDGALAAGEYYLVIAPWDAVFSDGFGVSSDNTAEGSYNLRVSSGVDAPNTPPSAIDLGPISDPGVTRSGETMSAGAIVWFRFELPEPAEVSKFLDIDTEGSALSPSNDTIAALFNDVGALVAWDDDDGSGRLSQLSFGVGSTTPTVGNGRDYAGQEGVLPAGVYYAGVTGFGNTVVGAGAWAMGTEHELSGTVTLRLHTNTVYTPPGCEADFNGDGFVDFFDFDDFVACFEGVVCPPGKSADFNGDGFADFFDYDDFVLAFETGCP